MIRDSFKKFKQDLIPKIYYDIFKGLGLIVILYLIYKLWGYKINFNEILDKEFSLSVFEIVLIIILFMILTAVIIYFIYNKKINSLKTLNRTDERTGLKNHKYLIEYLKEKINDSRKNKKSLSVILIDIDDFKRFNEYHTPTIGDKIIIELGRLLHDDNRITDQTFRRYETGDEFVVVSTETNISQAKVPAERKREFIAKHNFIIDSKTYRITVCCGIAQYKDSDTVESLLDRANFAMRNIAKKKKGKNSTEHAS